MHVVVVQTKSARPPYGSPELYRWLGIDVPRYYYHVKRSDIPRGKGIQAYTIRETEAADRFGGDYANHKYIWMGVVPLSFPAFKVDITKLDNDNLRFTGQAEGHLLHRGDIPEEAIVDIVELSGRGRTREARRL